MGGRHAGVQMSESQQGPVGLLGTEAFQTAANQEREGMWRQ